MHGKNKPMSYDVKRFLLAFYTSDYVTNVMSSLQTTLNVPVRCSLKKGNNGTQNLVPLSIISSYRHSFWHVPSACFSMLIEMSNNN